MKVEVVVETLKNKKLCRYTSGERKKPRKRKYKKKKDFLSNSKPLEGTSLYKYYKHLDDIRGTPREQILKCSNSNSSLIKIYKGSMTYEEFVDAYLNAIHKRTDIIPNIYCSRAWLLAHKDTVVPCRSMNGYLSFCKDTATHFFLPAYKYVDGDVLVKTDNCLVTVPQALRRQEGIRYDVQYMFIRDVSLYMIPKALKIRNTMKKIPYKTYPIQYTDHSKDEKLNSFLAMYKQRNIHGNRVMTDDYDGFVNMLFNDYGQHRYVIERTDTHRILAVIIWEDIGDVIHMLYTVGCMEPPEDYGYDSEMQWKTFRREKALRYPETILRYEFFKRFPIGTIFNGGGCSSYEAIRWMQEISQPSHVHELRTYADVQCPFIFKGTRKPVGKLPGEYFLPGKRSIRFKIDEQNRVLFQGIVKRRNSNGYKSKSYKRHVARMLKLRNIGKNLKKF